ncbi:MAG: PD40 domain-containing protein, partial [Actinobacteria bacterium]|nr:PD40 domain-containing protein [Actinomycetota bacterium]
MPGIDERLKHELERLAAPADLSGAFERIASKRRRHRALRKVWTSLLGVAVIAGTVAGAYSLNRVFRVGAGGGGQVAFVRLLRPCYEHPNVEGGLEVFAVDVVTGEQRLLSFDPTFPDGTLQSERWPDLSPDGTRYVWVDHYRGDLYVTDVLTGETHRLTNGLPVGPPHFSPDGSKILFSAEGGVEIMDEATGTAQATSDIYVINADGTGRTRLTEGSVPSWTPDGRIAFMRTHARVVIDEQGDVTRVETIPQPTEFFLMSADGSGIEKVYEAPGDVAIVSGEWSPDGTKLLGEAVVRGNHDIYVVDIEGRTATRLTDDPAQDPSPTWSPDGSMIAFQTGRWGDFTGHAEIAVINADGTGLRRLTNDCWQDQDPAWIPDDAAVAKLPVWTPP